MTLKQKRVLVAFDGTKQSIYALKWALDFFIGAGDTVVLLWAYHAKSTSSITVGPEVDMSDDHKDGLRSVTQHMVEENLRTVARDILEPRQVQCELIAIEGDPRSLIAAQAKQANVDCVVIGSRGLGAVKRIVHHSVSDSVVRHCKVPVTVVNMPDGQ